MYKLMLWPGDLRTQSVILEHLVAESAGLGLFYKSSAARLIQWMQSNDKHDDLQHMDVCIQDICPDRDRK